MNLKPAIKILFPVMLLFLLSGCRNSDLHFSVQFERLGDLNARAAVYLERAPIGQVKQISSTDRGDFLVEVSIPEEHRSKVTQSARFYIGEDPQDSEKTALVMLPGAADDAPLEADAIVKGVPAPGLLDSLLSSFRQNADEASVALQQAIADFKRSAAVKSNELNRQLESSLGDINRQFREFDPSSLAPSDAEIRVLEESLDAFIAEFERAGKELQDQLRLEVIPQLRRDLKALKKKLQRERRDEELEKVERKLQELTAV